MASSPVKPSCPPSPVVQPCNPAEFKFDDRERWLFDSVAQEHTQIVSTQIEYFSIKYQNPDYPKQKKTFDPLYGEPVCREWTGPFLMAASITKPEGTPEVREEGFQETWDATVWIARAEFEAKHCPYPNEGDALRIWPTPYWDAASVFGFNIPRAGMYFDVQRVDEDGILFSGPSFVGYSITVRRRTDFTTERRIVPP